MFECEAVEFYYKLFMSCGSRGFASCCSYVAHLRKCERRLNRKIIKSPWFPKREIKAHEELLDEIIHREMAFDHVVKFYNREMEEMK